MRSEPAAQPSLDFDDVLLAAARRALAGASPGVDVAAVTLDTPLGALFFDSFVAVSFIGRLEIDLGVSELPFELWLREHSESTDLLTVRSLVEWLASQQAVRARCAALPAPRTTRTGTR